MRVKPVPKHQMEQCLVLFRDLSLYSTEDESFIFPNIVMNRNGELVVVAPYSVSMDRFEKALDGLGSIFGRKFIGLENLGNHRWLLQEYKLPDLVPYASRPADIPFGAYWLGTYADGSSVILEFEHSPVLLVAGASGSGKSELFKVLLKEIERTWSAEAITIAEGTKAGNDFRHQPCKQLVTETEEVLEVYEHMLALYEKRKQLIRKLDVDHWLEARRKGFDWKPAYFLIDECPLFLSPPKKGAPDFEVRSRIIHIASHLAMRGRYVGLFQILGTQDPSSTGLPSDIMNQVRLKIGYSMRTAEMARAYFGQSTPPIANDLVKGKGVAMLGQEPKLFRGAKKH